MDPLSLSLSLSFTLCRFLVREEEFDSELAGLKKGRKMDSVLSDDE